MPWPLTFYNEGPMFDPVLAEIVRVKDPANIQTHALRRWQQHLRDVIDPRLVRVADLEDQLAHALAQLASEQTTETKTPATRMRQRKQTAA